MEYLRNLDKRREEIRNLINEQENLTDEISVSLDKAVTLSELEDIYRPFKPKRKTRASVAKEKGLEPLAIEILLQDSKFNPNKSAEKYVNAEKGVDTVEDAINGAKDIIAEQISDNSKIRKTIRKMLNNYGTVVSVASDKDKDSVYRSYYEYSEPVKKIADHRLLAINRGEKDGFLKVSIQCDDEKFIEYINNETINYKMTYAVTLSKKPVLTLISDLFPIY